MTSQSTGIQQLLSAEKKAAEKVSEARKRKYSNIIVTAASLQTPADVPIKHLRS